MPLVMLVVMYATWRSTTGGVIAALGLAMLAVPALARPELLTAAGGAGSGVLLGLVGRKTRGAPAAGALLLGGSPLAAGLVVRSLVWEQELLRARLLELVETQAASMPLEARRQLAEMLLGLAPASEALFGFAMAFFCYALARRFFPRLGVEMRPLGRLERLRIPFGLVWSFALALLLTVLGRAIGERWLMLAGLNLAVVHAAAFLIEGLAVGRYVCQAQAMPGFAQAGFALVALMMPPLPFVVAGIGFFDLWFDFRRLLVPPAAGGTGSVEGGSGDGDHPA